MNRTNRNTPSSGIFLLDSTNVSDASPAPRAKRGDGWGGAAVPRLDKSFRWHDLRHTWATWQRQAGIATHELQRLGGWRTGVMVERYAPLAPENLAVAASRLDSVLVQQLRCSYGTAK